MSQPSASTVALKVDVEKTVVHTSAVQAPELEGWKKLSVEAINFAKESRAIDPAKYVFALGNARFPRGAER